MSVWDEPVESPAIPAEDTTQPAETEPEAQDTSEAENTESSVESPSAGEEARDDEAKADDEGEEVVEDEAARQARDGEAWAIKAYREEKKNTVRLKQELAEARQFDEKFLSAQPADAILDDLFDRSRSRYSDLGHGFYQRHKDVFLESDPNIGMTYDEVVSLVKQAKQPPTDTTAREAPQDAETDYDPDDLPDSLKAKLAKLEKLEQLEKDYPQLKAKVDQFAQTEQQRAQQQIEREQGDIRGELLTQITSHAEEHLAERLGLKALPDDPPEVAEYIKSVNQALKERLFNEFDAKPEYASDTESIADAIERRDKKRALSYVPKAKVTAELVLDSIAKPYQAALRAMRSKPTQKPSPQPPIVNGQSGSFVPSDNIVRGKGVDAVWESG